MTRFAANGRVLVVVLVCWLSLARCKPTPVVDLPASDLDAKIVIGDADPMPSDGKVLVGVQFFHNGQYVQLGGSATVKCNGTVLPFSALGYLARVPIVPVGGGYTFVHTRGSVTSSIPVTVPPRPVILSPANGATVTRSAGVTITYTADGGSDVTGGASGNNGSSAVAMSGNAQPDNGTYTGLNTASFVPGAGSVDLTRKLASTPSGTGFNSVSVQYSTGSKVNVTWN